MKPGPVGIDLSHLGSSTLAGVMLTANGFFDGGTGIAFPARVELVSRVTVSAR